LAAIGAGVCLGIGIPMMLSAFKASKVDEAPASDEKPKRTPRSSSQKSPGTV
jgi:hypothetical protein